jgi:hypothetical protein
MNTIGNLIRIVKTIVLPGVSVEGTDNMRLKHANANPATIIPIRTIIRFTDSSADRKIIPNIKGSEEKIIPYIKVLQTLPKRIVFIEIGQVINLSKVLLIVSHGKTIGPIDVDVRNVIIAINPEITYVGSTFLPMVKAIKSIIGKSIP